jgi:hypothetical protein
MPEQISMARTIPADDLKRCHIIIVGPLENSHNSNGTPVRGVRTDGGHIGRRGIDVSNIPGGECFSPI